MKKVFLAIFFLFTSSAWAVPLPAPTLVSPVYGYTAISLDPIVFTWDSVSGSTFYYLEISINSGFTVIVNSAMVVGLDYSLTGWINKTAYYWRVSAYDSTTGLFGDYSIVHRFEIDITCENSVVPGDGYCVGSWPTFPFKYNGPGACRNELPTLLYPGLDLVIDRSPCFGNDIAWYDNYYASKAWSCDNAHVEHCIDGDWKRCGYEVGVEVAGYTCWINGASVCGSGIEFRSCSDIITAGVAAIPDNRSSINRFPMMDYLGIVTYKGGSITEGYKLWGEQVCSDDISFKRSNDDISVSNYNNESYSFESVFHNDLPLVLEPVSKYIKISGTYVFDGVLPRVFGRDDVIQSFYGQFMFDGNISNTNCSFTDYRFVSDPSLWWECSLGKNEGDTCSYTWQGVTETFTCGPSQYNENYFGMEAYSYDDSYYGGSYDLWQVWRYPVDDNFVSSGPIELVIDNGEGYVSSPGGIDLNDLVTDEGYSYRFYAVMDEIISSYDFNSLPCVRHTGSGGSGVYLKSRISRQKITDHTVGGAYERRY